MKISREQVIFISLIILMVIIGLFLNNQNRRNVRKVETRIDTLAIELKQMSAVTRSLTENLRQTIELIGNVSANLESSGKELETLLHEARSMTAGEKQKIRAALKQIEDTRKSVEEERIKAMKLIGELNTSEDVQK